MNDQPPPQEDPVPAKWKTRWYRLRFRFLRCLSRLLSMPPSLDVEQALKSEQWKSFQHGMEHYLGHCPFHPEEGNLFALGQGHFLCYSCKDAAYLKSLDDGPHTDPHQTMPLTDAMKLAQRHPSLAMRLMQHTRAGTATQEFRAVHWPKSGEKKE